MVCCNDIYMIAVIFCLYTMLSDVVSMSNLRPLWAFQFSFLNDPLMWIWIQKFSNLKWNWSYCKAILLVRTESGESTCLKDTSCYSVIHCSVFLLLFFWKPLFSVDELLQILINRCSISWNYCFLLLHGNGQTCRSSSIQSETRAISLRNTWH